MYLQRLELTDFRCYASAQLSLGPGVRVLVGPNAQGKTNLLEAIHYLSVGGSHRVTSDAPLVRAGAATAIIRAVVTVEGGRQLIVEYELRPGGRNRARVNGQTRPRAREAIGLIRSVLFAPEDLQLIRGDPGDRRRFLDDLLAQRRPAYLSARHEYERILRQRNALLREARGRQSGPDSSLHTWTDALVRAGATLLAARIAAVHGLAGPVDRAYGDLVGGAPRAPDRVLIAYELSTGRTVPGRAGQGMPDPAELADELRERLAEVAADERDRGMTLVGPHRDELLLRVGDLPAKGFASHGESWSLALALRLAGRDLLHEVGGEPVILLDDVFTELDEARRKHLADRCAGFGQTLVTAAVDADVPLAGKRYQVYGGGVTAQPVMGEEAG